MAILHLFDVYGVAAKRAYVGTNSGGSSLHRHIISTRAVTEQLRE